MSDDPFTDMAIEKHPTVEALENLFKWIEEDYGPHTIACVVADMMMCVRAFPEKSIDDIIDEIALDWSK